MYMVPNPDCFWGRWIYQKFRKLIVIESNEHLGLMDHHVMETAEHDRVV